MKVYQQLASLIQAYHNCLRTNNDYADKHQERVEQIADDYLPSGSGFDSGTTIDIESSDGVMKIILETSFHHMSEYGFYCGWSDHRITILSSFHGFDWTTESDYSGMDDDDFDREGFEDYLTDCLYHSLTQDIKE